MCVGGWGSDKEEVALCVELTGGDRHLASRGRIRRECGSGDDGGGGGGALWVKNIGPGSGGWSHCTGWLVGT